MPDSGRVASPRERNYHEGTQAKGVYLALAGASTSSKNKLAAGLLGIFLGGWGIHKFYLGFTGPGLVFLLVNTVGFAVTWIFLCCVRRRVASSLVAAGGVPQEISAECPC